MEEDESQELDTSEDEGPIDERIGRRLGETRSVEKRQNDGSDGDETDRLIDPLEGLIVEDVRGKQRIRKMMVSTREPALLFYDRDGLLSTVRYVFSRHRLLCGAQIMSALVRDQRIPHSMIVKSAFILFTNHTSEPDLLLQSMKKMTKYDVNKKEIILEMILHFIRNDDRIGAKNYIDSNDTILKSQARLKYRKHRSLDTILRAYIAFVDHMEWKDSVSEERQHFTYASNRILAQKTKLDLSNIITENKDMLLDVFVLILLEMYEWSQQFAEAVDLLNTYIDNNVHHLNAYIYLYNFGHKYPDYVSSEQIVNCLKNILNLSPGCPLVLELVRRHVLSIDEEFELLMEFLDHKSNWLDTNGWILLKELITLIDDKIVEKRIKKLFNRFYMNNWFRIHCRLRDIIDMKDMDENVIEIYVCKHLVITYFYNKSHKCYEYYDKTNELITNFQRNLIL